VKAVAGNADPLPTDCEERVLLLAPSGRDAELLSGQLTRRGFTVAGFDSSPALCAEVALGAGVLFIASEALAGPGLEHLVEALRDQPPWSDLPLVIMTEPGATTAFSLHLETLFKTSSNFTLLERPIRLATLFSVVASALKSRRRQYEVRRLLEETKLAVVQRDQFLAMLGHELRNPLAAMVSATRILRDFGSENLELAAEQTDLVARQAFHMTRLVDDLLDVARITSGKISLNLQLVDLRETAAKALQTLKLMTGEQRHDISFHTTRLPVVVEGDPVRMEQVIVNLLNNAIKYTPAGGQVWLSVSDGEEAVLRVRDSGEGLSEEMLDRIFEPFAQVTPTLARSRGGLGIGLAVVKTLVQMHKGRVSVHSDGPGKGSEFVIHLPVIKTTDKTPPRVTKKRATRPCKILLVEDNADARLALARLLRLYGHHVETAEDGSEGLEKILATEVEVVLLDIGLPGLNGYEVAARIRATHGAGLFLIALTGYGQLEDREKARQAGFDLHLVKPIDPEQLNEILAKQYFRPA